MIYLTTNLRGTIVLTQCGLMFAYLCLTSVYLTRPNAFAHNENARAFPLLDIRNFICGVYNDLSVFSLCLRDDQGEDEDDAEWNFAMDTVRAPKEPSRKNVLPESSQQQESTVEQNHVLAEEPARPSWVASKDLERRDDGSENTQEKKARLSNGVDHLESHSLSQNSAMQNSLPPERGSESQQYNGLVSPASSTESQATNADKMEDEEENPRESVNSNSLPDTRELDEALARSSVVSIGSVGSQESSGSGGSGGHDKPPPSTLNQVTDIDNVMADQETGKEEEMKGKGYSDLEASREVSGTCVYVART